MKSLILKIKGIDTIIKCLKPVNDNTYIDNIIKGFDYNNISQTTLIVQNICESSFILPAQSLFTQNDNLASTFNASIVDTLIPGNSIVNVPVYYNGIYNGNINDPIYTFVLNGLNIVYQLIITVPDTLGTITDIPISLGNRVNYTFLPSDFTSHHNDVDGDTLTSVSLFGNVGTIRFNNLPYITDTEVTFVQIQAGLLKHIAPDTNTGIQSTPDYKVKDSLGNTII